MSSNDREGLLRLVRYGARGPVAESRLTRREDGRYAYETKKGVTLVLTAAQLVKRLDALIPPRSLHLVNFHGVFSSHAAERPNVMPKPREHQKPVAAAPPKTKTKRPRIDFHEEAPPCQAEPRRARCRAAEARRVAQPAC